MSTEDKRIGVYIHIPFCASKCAYCDFCSVPGRDKLMPLYQDALLIQLQESLPDMKDYFMDSVYFGGGTPSYYGHRRLIELLQEIKASNRLLKESEITVECNPDSVRRRDLQELRKEGVNRISIGAQSANDQLLRLIGRRHSWRQVVLAVKRARQAGFRNISLDLIYGLPGQTREDWADTLAQALALKPAHLSCYGLRLEEGTPMYEEFRDSPLIPDDDTQADMYLYTVDTLERNGYYQYEVSNFARRGYESRHNLKYWRLGDYIGFGASAHSNIGMMRYAYTRNIRKYISGVLGDKDIIDEQEELTNFDRGSEYLMLGMRTCWGISREEYQEVYQSPFEPLQETLEMFRQNGWVALDNDRWHFTPGGFLLSNVLIGALLESQTKEKFQANPWIREAFEKKGESVPLSARAEPYMT